jgi:hypothetical protein
MTRYSSMLSNIKRTAYLVAKNKDFGWYYSFFEFAQSIKKANLDNPFGS